MYCLSDLFDIAPKFSPCGGASKITIWLLFVRNYIGAGNFRTICALVVVTLSQVSIMSDVRVTAKNFTIINKLQRLNN